MISLVQGHGVRIGVARDLSFRHRAGLLVDDPDGFLVGEVHENPRGDHRTRSLSCVEQFRVMAFAQLTYRESLRDIEVCLAPQAGKLYHMGIGAVVARSTLADANESRDWRI